MTKDQNAQLPSVRWLAGWRPISSILRPAFSLVRQFWSLSSPASWLQYFPEAAPRLAKDEQARNAAVTEWCLIETHGDRLVPENPAPFLLPRPAAGIDRQANTL
jgi:hypothetical protein